MKVYGRLVIIIRLKIDISLNQYYIIYKYTTIKSKGEVNI